MTVGLVTCAHGHTRKQTRRLSLFHPLEVTINCSRALRRSLFPSQLAPRRPFRMNHPRSLQYPHHRLTHGGCHHYPFPLHPRFTLSILNYHPLPRFLCLDDRQCRIRRSQHQRLPRLPFYPGAVGTAHRLSHQASQLTNLLKSSRKALRSKGTLTVLRKAREN